MQTDVLIIGAGVLGTSVAYHLAKKNIKSIVLERESTLAQHASGKNAGMIRQLYHHPQLTSWTMRSINSWPEEVHKAYFRETGSYIVGRNRPKHHSDLFEEREINSQAAVYCKSDGLLESSGYINLLYKLTDKNLAKFRFKTNVCSLLQKNGKWSVETDSGEKLSANYVINAAGAWVNSFLEKRNSNLKLEANAFARYLYLTKGWGKDYMPAKNCGFYWEEENGWYMRIWDKDSRLVSVCDLISANPDNFSPNPQTSHELAQKLMLSLTNDVSERLTLGRSWHCFRTYTEDKLPIWGEDPEAPGLFWLAAFGGFGMSTSYAAAFDAAEYIAGEDVKVASEFSPLRVRHIKTKQKVAQN